MRLSHRAEVLLAMIGDPQSAVYASAYYLDGPWMSLATRHPNIGHKTCDELVKAGILKERPREHRSAYGQRWFRLATPDVELIPEDEDFGDLWVAA